MPDRIALEQCLNRLLEPGASRDYGPNGFAGRGRRGAAPGLRRHRRAPTSFEGHRGAGRCDPGAPRPVLARARRARDGLDETALEKLLPTRSTCLPPPAARTAHPELGNNAQLGANLAGRPTAASAIRTWCSAAHCWRSSSRRTLRRMCSSASAEHGAVLRKATAAVGAWPAEVRRLFEAAIAAGAMPSSPARSRAASAHLARETGVAHRPRPPRDRTLWRARPSWPIAVAELGGHQFIDLPNPA